VTFYISALEILFTYLLTYYVTLLALVITNDCIITLTIQMDRDMHCFLTSI